MIPQNHGPCETGSAEAKNRIPAKNTHALRARLAQLENTLQAHNIELPPQTPVDNAHRDLDSTRRRSARSISSGRSSDTSPHTRTDPILPSDSIIHCDETKPVSPTIPRESIPSLTISNQISPNDHVQAQNLDALELPGEAQTNLGNFEAHEFLGNTATLNADSSPSPKLTNYTGPHQTDPTDPDNITSSLAARMGSLQIAEDGQLRYYGPTSNLHLYHAGLHSLSRSTIRHVATEGGQVLARAGLDQLVAPDLERHLAELYFAWEDPAIHVVDEEVFFLEKQKWKSGHTNTPYYSETLNNAMQVPTSSHHRHSQLTSSAVRLGPVLTQMIEAQATSLVPSSFQPEPRLSSTWRWTVPAWQLFRLWSS